MAVWNSNLDGIANLHSKGERMQFYAGLLIEMYTQRCWFANWKVLSDDGLLIEKYLAMMVC